MSEQAMTATDLLDAHEAGRTAHMETRIKPAAYDDRGRLINKEEHYDVLVLDAEAKHEGQWRKVVGVFTDLNDDERPTFLDLDEPAERVVLEHDSVMTVRGLSS